MKRIYADNAATTPISRRALSVMFCTAAFYPGNPSSSHEEGREAKEKLEEYRERCAVCLDCEPNEIIFTSGATEGNNNLQACFVNWSSTIEHPSAIASNHHYRINVLSNGTIDEHELDKSIKRASSYTEVYDSLFSIMMANNEIGTIQPVEKIGYVYFPIRNCLFHTDATAAVGHIPVSFRQIGADYLTCSAHKFHGPRGIGMLVARNGTNLDSLLKGGMQERGHRAGTENLPAIAGMTVALEESLTDLPNKTERATRMRDRLIDGLLEIKGTVLNGDAKQRLPGNVNVSFDGIEGESLLAMLDANGIAASAGSACHTGSKEPSHVLLAIGRTREQANAALRLSIDETNTDEEIDYIIKTVRESVAYLRKFSPKWNETEM